MIAKKPLNDSNSILKIVDLYNKGDLTNVIRESQKLLNVDSRNPVIWNILRASLFWKN